MKSICPIILYPLHPETTEAEQIASARKLMDFGA